MPDGTTRVARPIAQRLVGADRPAGEDQVERAALTDQARQAHRAAVDQRHAPAPAEDAERRVVGHDPQVAPERQLEPARDRVPSTAAITGLPSTSRVGPIGPSPSTATRFTRVAAGFGHRLEVGAGAERAAGAR